MTAQTGRDSIYNHRTQNCSNYFQKGRNRFNIRLSYFKILHQTHFHRAVFVSRIKMQETVKTSMWWPRVPERRVARLRGRDVIIRMNNVVGATVRQTTQTANGPIPPKETCLPLTLMRGIRKDCDAIMSRVIGEKVAWIPVIRRTCQGLTNKKTVANIRRILYGINPSFTRS